MGIHTETNETPAAAFSRDVAVVERRRPLPWLRELRELEDPGVRASLVDAYVRSLHSANGIAPQTGFGWRGSLAILLLASAMPLGLLNLGLGLGVMVVGWTLAGSEVVRELVAVSEERAAIQRAPERLLNESVRTYLDRAVMRSGPDWYELSDEQRRARLEAYLLAFELPRLDEPHSPSSRDG